MDKAGAVALVQRDGDIIVLREDTLAEMSAVRKETAAFLPQDPVFGLV